MNAPKINFEDKVATDGSLVKKVDKNQRIN